MRGPVMISKGCLWSISRCVAWHSHASLPEEVTGRPTVIREGSMWSSGIRQNSLSKRMHCSLRRSQKKPQRFEESLFGVHVMGRTVSEENALLVEGGHSTTHREPRRLWNSCNGRHDFEIQMHCWSRRPYVTVRPTVILVLLCVEFMYRAIQCHKEPVALLKKASQSPL